MFSECSALNPNDEVDDDMNMLSLGGGGGFAGFDFDSMVTAKDIDDNGNLIAGHLSAYGDNDEEDGNDDEEFDEGDGDLSEEEEE